MQIQDVMNVGTMPQRRRCQIPIKLSTLLPVTDALSAGILTAFPEFDPKVHVCDDFTIPEHWIKWGSCDNGYRDPFAWYKFAIDEDGTTYIYYEYTRDKLKDPIINYKGPSRKSLCEIVR